MLEQISAHLRNKFKMFHLRDNLIFKSKIIPIEQENFTEIEGDVSDQKSVAFIDGGQAEILSGGSLCLSFIRVCAVVMCGNVKMTFAKHEFYVLATAVFREGEIWYEGKI